MSWGLHIGNMAVYSITNYPLCSVHHGKPDKCQEDFHYSLSWLGKTAKSSFIFLFFSFSFLIGLTTTR